MSCANMVVRYDRWKSDPARSNGRKGCKVLSGCGAMVLERANASCALLPPVKLRGFAGSPSPVQP